MTAALQPFLHDLVTTLAAPTQALSARTGDVLATGAQGIYHADVRMLSSAVVRVDGETPEHIATVEETSSATFTALLRRVRTPAIGHPDPTLRLDRRREVRPGSVAETLRISSIVDAPIELTLALLLATDLAPMEVIKTGAPAAAQPLGDPENDGDGIRLRWSREQATYVLTAPGAVTELPGSQEQPAEPPEAVELRWTLRVPPRGEVEVGWSVTADDPSAVVAAAPGARSRSGSLDAAQLRTAGTLDVEQLTADLVARALPPGTVDTRLAAWVRRSLADLNGLRMSLPHGPAAGEPFFAAGSPWYFTLFGRDSLWAARFLLPIDRTHALGTLRTLAALQGRDVDTEAAEEPGKIMHELRNGAYAFDEVSLPPLYYGTIDATPLWICLLHDTWRAGAEDTEITALLPHLEAALEWLTSYGDADGDGFLEYIDTSGHGLANQGWKDSGDSVRFADGSIATGPVALCEVQGYAYEAAVHGADLLDAYGRPGAGRYRDWAAALAERFRAAFWVERDGERFPALALDGRKRQVDSITSNIGHLLGTGLLSGEEERLVAERLARSDLDSGLGLRTMSDRDGGYSPLSYHCGSVWPHDTAVAIAGMVRSGLAEYASGLVEGLLRASVSFDRRFPELWSGEGPAAVPYPAACRPQAWSAASVVPVVEALAALHRTR